MSPRRIFLRGLALVPLVGANPAPVDPIFVPIAEIRAHRKAAENLLHSRTGDWADYERLSDLAEEALQVLAHLQPCTAAGVAEYLALFEECERDFDGGGPMFAAVRSAIAALRQLA